MTKSEFNRMSNFIYEKGNKLKGFVSYKRDPKKKDLDHKFFTHISIIDNVFSISTVSTQLHLHRKYVTKLS